MLTKSLCLCFLALAMPAPGGPAEFPPDMQKIMERLDKLEDENQQLLGEIHELRNELTAAEIRRRLPDPQQAPRRRTARRCRRAAPPIWNKPNRRIAAVSRFTHRNAVVQRL